MCISELPALQTGRSVYRAFVTDHLRDDRVGAKGEEIMKREQMWNMLGEVLKEPLHVMEEPGKHLLPFDR